MRDRPPLPFAIVLVLALALPCAAGDEVGQGARRLMPEGVATVGRYVSAVDFDEVKRTLGQIRLAAGVAPSPQAGPQREKVVLTLERSIEIALKKT